MSHIQHTQNTITCDTLEKIRTAQRKPIKDSREIINSVKRHNPTIQREGMTRSIHYTGTQINPELSKKSIVNSYATKIPTKYLLNSIYFTFTFTGLNEKQATQAVRDIRTTILRLGYKIAPVEQRLVANQIYRHEARVHKLNSTKSGYQVRVDICDYAIRPIYIGGYLLVDQRPYVATSCHDGYAMARRCSLQTHHMPIFDSSGHYYSYQEVPRKFYDDATGIEAPKLFPPSMTDEVRQASAERMRVFCRPLSFISGARTAKTSQTRGM